MIASATLKVPAGATKTAVLRLNGSGKQLRSGHKTLHAKLTVLQGSKTVATKTVTIQRPKAKKH